MPHSSARQKICTLDAEGEITPRQCEDHVQQMVACACCSGYQKFLLDLRETVYVGNATSQYWMAYKQAENIGVSRSWKVALLVEPTDHSRDFQTITAQNAGFNLRQFHRRSAAIDWLYS